MPQPPVSIADVLAAADRLKDVAHRTPVQSCRAVSERAGVNLRFKCEPFQKTGSFKFRGAFNAVSQLTDAQAAGGVVTQSSGNHAQALALAARMRGIQSHIVMPTNTPKVKVRAVEGYGAHIVFCEPTLAAREATAMAVQQSTGACYLPPYNHPDIIAGQGTVALEFVNQVPDLDALVAPVGGGGLISGLCVAARALKPGIRIFAAEPFGADDTWQSKQAGRLIPQTDPRTMADGLRTSLGELTWPFVRDEVERVIRVSEDEMVQAMRVMWERAKLMIEPSSAVAVAAVWTDEFKELEGLRNVGVILTGGNVDLDELPWVNRQDQIG